MRFTFSKLGALFMCAAANSYALSLYEMAPAIGLPESHVAKYHTSVRYGYDTNVRGQNGRNKSGSSYVNAGLGGSYSDFESIDKISYNAHLGATYYLQSRGYGAREKWRADSSLSGTFSHAFSAMSRYNANLSLSYRPEPEYSNGISSQGRTGDCFTWNFNNSYNEAIDSRWSWNINGGYSGTKYSSSGMKKTHSWNDNREYITASAGLSYRESDLTSYTLSFSGRDELRSYGENSTSYTASLGYNRSLTPTSSMHVTGGVQCKIMDGDQQFSPTFSAGYNRTVTEGLSVRTYTHFSNENIDSYRGAGRNYKNVYTWRTGIGGSYRFTPDVSFNFDASYMNTTSTGSTNHSLPSEKRNSYRLSTGMSYVFTEHLTGNINVNYAMYENGKTYGKNSSYDRIDVSTGFSYSF